MKLHDLRPADGSHTARTRVGRGIAAGKGKTAGRGTKGQKARAGGSIPPWFEGGQTPLHMRIPKLRGFKNRFKVEYEVVNVGAIGELAERGAFEVETPKKGGTAGPITINQDILRAVGLVRTLNKPLKILGAGELSTALFVVADAFTASARTKIEAAGGSVNVLEVPTTPLAALGVTPEAKEPAAEAATATPTEPSAAIDEAPAKPAEAPAKPASRTRAAKGQPAGTAAKPAVEAPEPAEPTAQADQTADAPETASEPSSEPEPSTPAETSPGDDA